MDRKRRRVWVYVILIAVIIVIIAAVLFWTFVFNKVQNCADRACFNSAMEKCSKASFLDDNPKTTWQYTIKGKKDTDCVINTVLLQVKTGAVDLDKLNELEMDCSLPLGYAANPQDDLSRCHGLLKENLQEMMINKMYKYIVENIGKISEELTKAV